MKTAFSVANSDLPFTERMELIREYAKQVAEQALKDAAEKITLGQTVTAIQKTIRSTPIKLP